MRSIAGVVLVLLCLSARIFALESAIQIPLLDRSAKAAATGEGGAFLSGLDALGTNPAGLAGAPWTWNANYRSLPLDTSVNGLAFCFPVPSAHATVAFSYTSLRSAGLERRDTGGALQGEFRQEDQMVGLHVAGPLPLGDREMDAGASVKSIHSRIDQYNGSGMAFDLGLRYRFQGIPLTLAAAALNVGEGPKLLNERSALPTSYGVSASFPTGPVTVFGGTAYQPGQDILNLSLGAETVIGHVLAFRGNYAGGTGAEGRTGWGQFVGGIGISIGKLKLDYAFQPAGQDLADAGAPATQHATLTFIF